MQVVIQIPDELEQKLTERDSQLNVPLEAFILEPLVRLIELSDPDDTPDEVIFEGLRGRLTTSPQRSNHSSLTNVG